MIYNTLHKILLMIGILIMAIDYSTLTKTARMDAVLSTLDASVAPAYIEIGTTGMASVLATLTLADPSGSVTGPALSFTMPQSDLAADATGTAAEARLRNGDADDVITGLTVGLTGTDIVLDSVDFTAGQTVTLNSAVITHG